MNLQSANEQGPLFQEQTNISVTLNSLIIRDIKDFFYWWYIQMPFYYLLTIRRTSVVLLDKLSIKILYLHFFTPLQRKYTPLNMALGILVKLIYLPIATSIYLTLLTLLVLLFISWLILPFMTTTFLVLSPMTT